MMMVRYAEKLLSVFRDHKIRDDRVWRPMKCGEVTEARFDGYTSVDCFVPRHCPYLPQKAEQPQSVVPDSSRNVRVWGGNRQAAFACQRFNG
jgi:hypothetical protein